MLSLVLDFCTLAGLWVFFSGGLLVKASSEQPFIVLEISYFGLFFLPHLILFSFGRMDLLRKTFSYRAAFDLLDWMRSNLKVFPKFFPVSIFAGLGILYGLAAVQRYRGFWADWDLAIYANACANNLYSSLRWEKLILADHFEPVLGLFVPLCQAIDPAIALLIIQTTVWMLGALGFYFFCLRLNLSPLRSFLLGILYFLFPQIIQNVFLDFHMIVLAIGLIPWILWCIAADRLFWLIPFVALYLGLKETAGLTMLGLGLWLFLRGKKTAGLVISLVAAAVFVVVVKKVVPYYRGGEESFYFGKLYGHLGKNMEEVFVTLLTRPFYVLSLLFSIERIRYLFYVFLPFAFLHFLRPIHLLMIAPALMLNLLSSDGFYHSGGFHYEAEIAPWLMGTFVILAQEINAAVFKGKDIIKTWILVISVVFSGAGIGAYLFQYQPTDESLRIHAKLATLVPDADLVTKKVAAIEKVATHLAKVRNLYLLDRWQEADLVVIAYPQGKRLWHIPWNQVEMEIVPELNKTRKLIYQDELNPTFRIWSAEK